MSTCTFPEANYMIENADSKGQFLTVENGSICLHSKDPHSVQVWKVTSAGGNWIKFQGVPPDAAKEGKVIGADMNAYTLVYGDGVLDDFQLEDVANDTYRVVFDYYERGLFWKIDSGKSVSFTDNLTYAANWRLTKYSK